MPVKKTPTKKATEPLKLDDYVKIPYSGHKWGRIVGLRGPLGPGGMQIYRVFVRRKPTRIYYELTEDQMRFIPPEEVPADVVKSLGPRSGSRMNGPEPSPLGALSVEEGVKPAKKSAPPLKPGDLVKIPHSSFDRAEIVERHGPQAQDGVEIYRVRIGGKRKPLYIELREDQLELLPAAESRGQAS